MHESLYERLKRTKAVILDLDDTLIESTVDFTKFKRLVIERIASYGQGKEDYYPNESIISILERFEEGMARTGVPEGETKRRLAEMDKIMDSVEMERVSETAAYDGAARLLTLLRNRGIKVGVLTRGCKEYADQALTKTKLAGLIDAVECRNSSTKPKPDPEAYLKLVRALGVDKDETIFVGDHPIDGKCAKNADVPFVAVLTGEVPEEVLHKAGAIEVFTDVGDMADWLDRAPRN
jgi:HAD superfamily hydrolase (TIGR01549 family)